HYLAGPDPQTPNNTITKPVLWWLKQNDPELVLQALRHPDSQMIIPGDPGASYFYTFWIDPNTGPMGSVFAMPSKIEGYPTRRDVVGQWITDKCPLPSAAPTLTTLAAASTSGDAVAAIIQAHYQDASQEPAHNSYPLVGPGSPSNATVLWWFKNNK